MIDVKPEADEEQLLNKYLICKVIMLRLQFNPESRRPEDFVVLINQNK